MVTSQKCCKCNKQKKLTSFYTHRLNKKWNLHDCICKDCVKKLVNSKETMKEYCNITNRKFRDDLWEWCENKVKNMFETDINFNSLEEKVRDKKFISKVISSYFSQMNQSQYYEMITNSQENIVVDEITNENTDKDLEEVLNEEKDYESIEKNKENKIWSQDWRGYYTKSQIEWLDAYYSDTLEDYTVKTRNHKDYCRKIAKASLTMDEASTDILNGVPGAEKRYDKASAAFDKFSQSAKLSEKTRSTTDVSGLGSLSEIVAQLEQTGFLQKKMTFEKDDIDKIGDDFRWTISSVGGEF